MERKIFFGILGITLIALALAILLPGGRTLDEHPRLPWLIEVDGAGYPSVFGITIGRSTLQQARDNFQQRGETNLFVSPAQVYAVETFFQNLYLSGIKADMVVTLDLDQRELEQMYQRGLRISQLESGAKKVRLSQPDMQSLATARIGHITYLPASELDAELVASRFGEPQRRITESSGISHWLYPAKGLDIALNPDGREVFQYLLPNRFDQAIDPLLNPQ